MATTAQHIIAHRDVDLLDRFIAAAEMASVANASEWVRMNLGSLIAAEVEGGQTIADVHAYAYEVRQAYIAATPAPAGANLGAVTDVHLAAAIAAVRAGD